MYVLGTAGHVDHGKSTLVHALTGIDPDRLPEEKEREMTIDLGFAWLTLPSGREVSIIDVPGHERFIKNMLAGVGGIDLALLVVAADESVMPQTREHLAVLDLLRVQKGIVVITKKDLVDGELLELVSLEVRETVKPTCLAGAPVLAVSAVTREGLPELASAIDHVLDAVPPKKDTGRPRLPIDRIFSISGFGTVVTGTLLDGSLRLGQEVEIVPGGLRSRIRGLQTHRQKVETASPGSRVAANLSGLATSDVKRGDVLALPGTLAPTRALDARIRLLPHLPRPLPHNAAVSFHAASSEVAARVRLLDRDSLRPGDSAWAQLVLAEPVGVVKGDLFIFRSPSDTLGGGEIIDPHARRHHRFHQPTLDSLEARAKGTAAAVLVGTLGTKGPLELGTLAKQCNLSLEETAAAVQGLAAERRVVALGGTGPQMLLLSAAGWEQIAGRAAQMVGEHHAQFPLRPGIPREELRVRLKVAPPVFAMLLTRLLAENVLADRGPAVALPTFEVALNVKQKAQAQAFLDSLARDPYSPPAEAQPDPEVLNLVIEQGQAVRVKEGIVFGARAYEEMVKGIVERTRAQGKITVAEVRDMFHTSRRYALALLEHLDELKVTRRTGDERVLR